MKEVKNTDNAMRNNLAKDRLDRIDSLFAAGGPLISSLFCIAQYFLDGTRLFELIAMGLYFLIVIAAYCLAMSKKQKKYEEFWVRVKKYAKAAGLLNPFVLAVGILLTIAKDPVVLLLCVAFVIAQIVMCIITVRMKNME